MDNIIKQVKQIVKEKMLEEFSGHDYWHVMRVYHNALHILEEENTPKNINSTVVKLAALLHDIGDYKITGSEEAQIEIPRNILTELKVDQDIIAHVINIIDQISFHKGMQKLTSIEAEIVQDADRLDAIGAIGIARAFAYGGAKEREIWNPEDQPKNNMSKEEYMNNKGSSINHFYEKLLLLKDRMNTVTGKKIAEERHHFMESFLEQFYEEWNGKR